MNFVTSALRSRMLMSMFVFSIKTPPVQSGRHDIYVQSSSSFSRNPDIVIGLYLRRNPAVHVGT